MGLPEQREENGEGQAHRDQKCAGQVWRSWWLRGWAAGSRWQTCPRSCYNSPGARQSVVQTPELVLPVGGSGTRSAGASAAPPPSWGTWTTPSALRACVYPSFYTMAIGTPTTPWLPGSGRPTRLPASAGNKWARRGGGEARRAAAPLLPAAAAPPPDRLGAGSPAAPLSACRSPGTPRAAGPRRPGSPPSSGPQQVRGWREGDRRRAQGLLPGAAVPRAGGGAGAGAPQGESGRTLGDPLEWDASERVGTAAVARKRRGQGFAAPAGECRETPGAKGVRLPGTG